MTAFSRIPFLTLSEKLTRAKTNFLRDVMRRPTGRAVVIEFYNDKDAAESVSVLPTDDLCATEYDKLITSLDAKKNYDLPALTREFISLCAQHNEVVDKESFLKAFAVDLRIVSSILSYQKKFSQSGPMSMLASILSVSIDDTFEKRFWQFISESESNKPESDRKVAGKEICGAYGLFAYFERYENVLPKAIRLKVSLKPGPVEDAFIPTINDISYYSVINEASVKSQVSDQLAQIFKSSHT